jgi:hypothetical protein
MGQLNAKNCRADEVINLLCKVYQMSGFYQNQSTIPFNCSWGAMFSLLEKKYVYLMGHYAIQLLKLNMRTKTINSHTTTALNVPLICFYFLIVIFVSFYVNFMPS